MTSAGWTAEGRPLLAGAVSGPALVMREPLSFWGGVEPATGLIIDAHHSAHNQRVAGRVLVLPHGRGSSSSSTVLAECLGAGTGPVAILLGEPDGILLLGALVIRELGGVHCPVVVMGVAWERIGDGDHVSVAVDGRVRV
ncbi:MAG: DUF126 domain-containing protein, partial [Chloroflexota bacterium]|nr:DUF126 domain-containing protein [Chloroflexota bacterium]